ncbi:hypothetical protein AGMMS4952_21170 [Spirochaetia bacterium]|nr:hypothetical protein AGMMS4952_21170 [Spirochaetia bacterium]
MDSIKITNYNITRFNSDQNFLLELLFHTKIPHAEIIKIPVMIPVIIRANAHKFPDK